MKILKILLILGISFNLIQCQFFDENDRFKKTTIVKLKGNNCDIFLKHVVWGLTGDNSRTYLSTNDKLEDTINEPYLKVLDFFYKLDTNDCVLHICKSDTLKRKNLLKIKLKINEEDEIDYGNYKERGFDNILYY